MTFVFDCDSTLIDCESLEELAAIALRDLPDKDARLKQMHEITNLGMLGEISFGESLSRRLKLFSANKAHVEELSNYLLDHITLSVLSNKQWFDENKERIYVVSGGFSDYLMPVLSEIGIKEGHVFANEFTYEDGLITGFEQENNLVQPNGKVKQVAELELPRPIVIIGDGSTDLEVRDSGEADEFWAITEILDRPSITTQADKVLRNFSELPQFVAEFTQAKPAKV